MSRAIAFVGSAFVFASLLGASTLDISVSPNSSKGCVASVGTVITYPAVNCPSSPFLISVLATDLNIGFAASPSATHDLSTLDSLSVDLWVADNPGLLKPYDAASEGGSVYLVVGGSQFLLGNFGGGATGLNAHPIGSPLALTLSVAPADLPAVFAALKSANYAFGLKVSRTSGDFEVINAAGATAQLQGVTPEPATVSLIGLGLAGLLALGRRRATR